MFEGKYADYLQIDKDFVAVFNEEVDREYKDLWKTFIPHEKFEEVFEKVIKALERANKDDAKSIWIYGPYGTGKTHAIFVIKHLLEDDIGEVEDYTKRRNLSSNLVKKLQALREREKILVVFKSGSGYIRTPERLLLEIQETIYKYYKDYCNESGSYKPNKTEIELLRERIDDKVINWNMLIEKNRADLKEVSCVEEIKMKLNEEDIDLDFVERLLNVLEKEGITIFRFSIEKFKDWIRELSERSSIDKILFIWDEFSEFFKPGAPLDILQEVAHITQELPFYLLIVTHRHLEHWAKTLTEDVQKLKDRFHYIHYTMEPVTIYKLISNVFYPTEKKSKDWNEYSELIWMVLDSNFSLLKEVHSLIDIEKNVSLVDFKRLLPIHPYTAYLSAKIAQWFGSSQRTLFKFLKSEEGSPFVTFLNNYPKNDWYLLTPDFLWDYFFVLNDEIAEFYPEVLSVINYWNSSKDRLTEDELRVFKVVMLLSALAKRVQDVSGHLRPLRSTLKLAFAGTPLYRYIEEVIEKIVNKHILREHKTPKDIEYWIPTHDIDQRDIEDIKRKLIDNFNEFISQNEHEFRDVIAHRRIIMKATSADEVLKGRVPKVNVRLHQIGTVLVLMKSFERVEDLKRKILELSKNVPNVLFLVSFEYLGEAEWNTIVTNMAYEKALQKSNKEKDAKYYQDEIKEIVRKWVNSIRSGRFYGVFTKFDSEPKIFEKIEGVKGIQEVLEDIVILTFPFGLDNIILNDPLWNEMKSKEGLRIGLQEFKFKANKGMYGDVYNRFVIRDRILDDEGNFTDQCEFQKEHPLCKMRATVKEIFEKSETISLSEIWEILQKSPFGLYSSPLGCFVFGVLMKEYSEGYYFTDGNVYGEIDQTKMIELLYDTISGKKEWKLLKISPEQQKFCKLIAEIFGLPKEDVKYPKRAIISLRSKIKTHYRYPLWILRYSIEKEKQFDFEEYIQDSIELIEILDETIKAPTESDLEGDMPKTTEDLIKEFVKCIDILSEYDYREILARLKKFSAPEKFRTGFEEFVLQRFFKKVHKEAEDFLLKLLDSKLRERLQEEPWAWKEEKVKEILDKMSVEFETSMFLSEIFGVREYFIDDFCKTIRDKIADGEYLPLWLYKYHPETDEKIEQVLKVLEEICSTELPHLVEYDFLLTKRKLEENKEMISKIVRDSRSATQLWIEDNLERRLGDKELDTILDKIKETISKNPKIGENQLLELVKRELREFKITTLRENIRKELCDILGTDDIKKFCREAHLPVSIVKYLPEFSDLSLPENISIDEILKSLTRIDNLREEELEMYTKVLEENKIRLKSLKEPALVNKAFKSFFGKDWIEGLFADDDIEDLKEYLLQSIGQNIEFWNENQIKREFEKWKSAKYKEKFYERLKEKIEKMDESDAKKLLKKMAEDSDLGLRIIKLLSG
ncbi:MAG: Uncharacterized protein XD48_0089 [Archaeoglobus fulgidus]|uniref:ATP-binding protein n=1 Tax=Archaeoglobus fulgidus TaxID=2234 RepID=A0A101E2R2_ARCFL|nr:MAG: Uncharacterized protein XD48_0089 [Archaeoglobus fulgidus]